jgi:hypothetical protein
LLPAGHHPGHVAGAVDRQELVAGRGVEDVQPGDAADVAVLVGPHADRAGDEQPLAVGRDGHPEQARPEGDRRDDHGAGREGALGGQLAGCHVPDEQHPPGRVVEAAPVVVAVGLGLVAADGVERLAVGAERGGADGLVGVQLRHPPAFLERSHAQAGVEIDQEQPVRRVG